MIQHSIVIDAPPSAVWDATLDLERWPQWTPTVRSVRLLDPGPLAVGHRALLRQPGLPETPWTVTVLEPQREFAWRARVRGLDMVARHLLEPQGAGTRNTLRLEVSGLWALLLAPLLKGAAAQALQKENTGLKARCEQKNFPK